MIERPTSPDALDELTGRIQDGDEMAFRALFEALYTPLLRFARGMARDAEVAEDLVQEAFVRLWDHRAALNVAQSLRAYLYRTVRNLALNQIRNDRTRHRVLDDDAIAGSAAVPRAFPDPDDRLAELDLSAELNRLIGALPPRQREALTLSRLQGLSHDEVAGVMGCAPRTVNNHLVAALAFLRRQLHGALAASLLWMLS